jgi:Eukaryotic translation initiation factor 3 subunit 7 (eIF-3)
MVIAHWHAIRCKSVLYTVLCIFSMSTLITVFLSFLCFIHSYLHCIIILFFLFFIFILAVQEEGNSTNSPRNLALEATFVNHNFSQQVSFGLNKCIRFLGCVSGMISSRFRSTFRISGLILREELQNLFINALKDFLLN